MRCCMPCKNLVSRTSNLIGSDGRKLLICDVLKDCDLQFASDADIRWSLSRLNALKTADEEPLPGRLAEKLLLTKPPSYHNVPTVAGERGKPLVASGYYADLDA